MYRQIIIQGLTNCLDSYMKNGSRSSKKSDCLNNMFVNCLKLVINNNKKYTIYTEHILPSKNYSNKKKCDVVLYYDNKPYIVFPLKFIMTNYLKNRNNYFENITGETLHLKWANPDLKIIPINFILDKIPCLKNTNINSFESINHKNSFDIYSTLIDNTIISDVYNVIVITQHKCNIGDKYDKYPSIIDLDENKELYDILIDNL
jgi:hypothetical protein